MCVVLDGYVAERMTVLLNGDLTERRRVFHLPYDGYFFAKLLELIYTPTKYKYSEEELRDLERYEDTIQELKSFNIPFREKVQLLQREGPWFIHRLLKPLVKKSQQRIRKDCPYPGCSKRGLLQLHSHLRQVHKLEDKTERQTWLDRARIAYTTAERSIVYKFCG